MRARFCQQDAAQAVDPADKAAAEPAGDAAAPDAAGHRQAPRGRTGGHRKNQGTDFQGTFFLFRVPGSWIWGWGLTSDDLICVQVEHIIREENMMAAQEILELFCELVSVRLPIIETQKFVAIPVFFF
jgi:hypothetical protein